MEAFAVREVGTNKYLSPNSRWKEGAPKLYFRVQSAASLATLYKHREEHFVGPKKELEIVKFKLLEVDSLQHKLKGKKLQIV